MKKSGSAPPPAQTKKKQQSQVDNSQQQQPQQAPQPQQPQQPQQQQQPPPQQAPHVSQASTLSPTPAPTKVGAPAGPTWVAGTKLQDNEAVASKKRGNAEFVACDFPAAIMHYTRALACPMSQATMDQVTAPCLLCRAVSYLATKVLP